MNDLITTWIRENASSLQPGSLEHFEEFSALEPCLQGTTVVGVGESSHGTREFFELRHRLLRYLVTCLGFTRLAAEMSYSAVEPVNSYVLGEEIDFMTVMTALGHGMWAVQEFAAVLKWLRSHNASVELEQRVRFLGVDFIASVPSQERTLAFLRELDRADLAEIEEAFDEIASAGKKLFLREEGRRRELRELTQRIFDEIVAASPGPDVVHHARAVSQWARINAPAEDAHLIPGLNMDVFGRSQYMAENLVTFLSQEQPGTKAVLWAHNFHVGVGYLDDQLGLVEQMGSALRARLGSAYYVFGLELGRGSYLAQTWSPEEKTDGELVVVDVTPAPDGSVPAHFGQAGIPSLALNLRGAVAPEPVMRWLSTPQVGRSIPWNRTDNPKVYNDVTLSECYDGVIFVDDTSPTTPV